MIIIFINDCISAYFGLPVPVVEMGVPDFLDFMVDRLFDGAGSSGARLFQGGSPILECIGPVVFAGAFVGSRCERFLAG